MCNTSVDELSEIEEAISLYSFFLEEARERNDEREVAFLKTQIQRSKRMKISIQKDIPFVEHPSETLYFAMMGE